MHVARRKDYARVAASRCVRVSSGLERNGASGCLLMRRAERSQNVRCSSNRRGVDHLWLLYGEAALARGRVSFNSSAAARLGEYGGCARVRDAGAEQGVQRQWLKRGL